MRASARIVFPEPLSPADGFFLGIREQEVGCRSHIRQLFRIQFLGSAVNQSEALACRAGDHDNASTADRAEMLILAQTNIACHDLLLRLFHFVMLKTSQHEKDACRSKVSRIVDD